MCYANSGSSIKTFFHEEIITIKSMAHICNASPPPNIMEITQNESSLRVKFWVLFRNCFCCFSDKKRMLNPRTRM